MDSHDKDLPLHANTNDILVRHFALDLTCHFDQHCFNGSITLFLDPVLANQNSKCVFSINDFQNTSSDSRRINSKTQPPDKLETNEKHYKSNTVPSEVKYKKSDNFELGKDKHGHTEDTDEGFNNHFVLVLDCCDLEISKVEELCVPSELKQSLQCGMTVENENLFSQFRCSRGPQIRFSVQKWYVNIWKDGISSAECFPPIVKIYYQTKAHGASLRWTMDQDNRPCVYSAAMWINNRSFFPCQEYGSFSTWQAYITGPTGLSVVMSGSDKESIKDLNNGLSEHSSFCSMPLPSFTLAIAVGYWKSAAICQPANDNLSSYHYSLSILPTCTHQPPCQITYAQDAFIPCRVFTPETLLDRMVKELKDYLPKCILSIQHLLGPSPFHRIDFVLFPSCSQDMAMCNPSLIFLSQSMLCGDQSMCIKVGHEISHFWWGLLIGAKDWTEEWLSEGFATYLEDSIHAKVMEWSEREYHQQSELRAYLRYRVLLAELDNTDESLQTLRPNLGEDPEKLVGEGEVMYVKNGINPDKLFNQVHYLKGYFLLRHLSNLVGVAAFNTMLREYVVRHHGQMVSSHDFLVMVFEFFPGLKEQGLSVPNMYSGWLDCPGLPKELTGFKPSPENPLFVTVNQEVEKWKKWNRPLKKKNKSVKRRKQDAPHFEKLETNQLVLLLEDLLLIKNMGQKTLRALQDIYKLSESNADVRHRWCELVIKHKYSPGFEDVRHFLINDQAMGVYLYGEITISRCKLLQCVAEQCFKQTTVHMEPGTRKAVEAMLYGSHVSDL